MRVHYLNQLATGDNGTRGQQLLWNGQDNVDAGIAWSEKLRTDENMEYNESAILWFKRQIAHAMYYNNDINSIGNMPTIMVMANLMKENCIM